MSKMFLFISILLLDLKRCIKICIARICFNYLIATFQNSIPKHCTTHLIENPPLTFTDIFDNFLHSSKVYVMCRGGDQIDLIGHDLRYQMKNNCAQWFVQFSFKSQWWWSKRMVVTQTRACGHVWSSFGVFGVFFFIMYVFDTDKGSILTESSDNVFKRLSDLSGAFSLAFLKSLWSYFSKYPEQVRITLRRAVGALIRARTIMAYEIR